MRRFLPLLALACLMPVLGCEDKAPPAAAAEASAAHHDDHAAHGAHAGAKPSAAAAGGADEAARTFFVFPQDGAKVFSPVTLVFGVAGMTVTPAGQHMEDKTRGHHHVIVDGEPVAAGAAVPADDTHIHFGKGQTETKLELAPGKHTLTLQFADGAHLSYGPAMASTIHVEVVEAKEAPRVFFEAPADGAKVKSPVALKFGIAGMSVRPAGQDPLDKTSGHHHVLVNTPGVGAGTVVPADDKHIHFGKGQTETTLELPAGKHTLTLQLADGVHASYGPDLSSTISIEVEP